MKVRELRARVRQGLEDALSLRALGLTRRSPLTASHSDGDTSHRRAAVPARGHAVVGDHAVVRVPPHPAPSQDVLRVLHVVVSVGPTNSQYNEHCLPVRNERQILVCSLLPASVRAPAEIALIEGNGTILGAVYALLTALGEPGVDVVHAHAPSSAALLLILRRSLRRMANCVFTLHGSYSHFRLRSRLLLHAVFAFFPTIVVCGHSPYRTLPSSLRRLGRGKIRVIQNGVDIDRVDRILARSPRARPTVDLTATRPFTVIFVGRLIDVKNPFGLLRAFVRLEDSSSRLVFVGDGHLRTHLMQEAARHAPGRVLFTGVVGRDDVYRHLANADVYVSMSYSEGLPVAVLEAMACRVPVVLSDISPHREIVGDADFVPLASPDDVCGVVQAIERLRQMPRVDRDEIAGRCRALVVDRFSVQAMTRQYERVYLDVARRRWERNERVQRAERDEISSQREVGRRSRPEGSG